MTQLRWAQVGNFDPPHSTENELRKAILANGHVVDAFQEGNPKAWVQLIQRLDEGLYDIVLWTRTASELNQIDHDTQRLMVAAAHKYNTVVVGYHLDIWWDLPRQREIPSVPYFTLVDFFCSADGGHDDDWEGQGVRHRWFPPGVSEFECGQGNHVEEFDARLGFVGCWDGSYHPEWTHRKLLVDRLRRLRARFWPEPGKHAVRGPALRDLYASVDVTVGDSCLIGPNGRYWSDRIPEALGRGGVLIHPNVAGLEQHFTPGVHLETWDLGDWARLDSLINELTHDPDRRRALSEAGRQHVLENHTYSVRIRQLVDMLEQEKALR